MPTPFPHLMPAERFVWARFLTRFGRQWEAFDYDVRLGLGRPVDPDLPDYIQRMAKGLSQKRLDAVGWSGGQPTLFEVTPAGSPRTIGHLRLYEWLWVRQYPGSPPPHLAAVWDRADPDTLAYCQATSITCYLVPETTPV